MSKPRVGRHAFTFMVPLPLWERLQKAIEVTRRSVTAEMTLALEKRLSFLEDNQARFQAQAERDRNAKES